MTAPMEDLDTRVIDKLHFDKPEPCDFDRNNKHGKSCERPAKWRVVLSCCGQTRLFCEKHMDDHLEAMAEKQLFMHRGPDGCGAEGILVPFRSAERI